MMNYVCDYCKKNFQKEEIIRFSGRAFGKSSKKGHPSTKFDLCLLCCREITGKTNGTNKTD